MKKTFLLFALTFIGVLSVNATIYEKTIRYYGEKASSDSKIPCVGTLQAVCAEVIIVVETDDEPVSPDPWPPYVPAGPVYTAPARVTETLTDATGNVVETNTYVEYGSAEQVLSSALAGHLNNGGIPE